MYKEEEILGFLFTQYYSCKYLGGELGEIDVKLHCKGVDHIQNKEERLARQVAKQTIENQENMKHLFINQLTILSLVDELFNIEIESSGEVHVFQNVPENNIIARRKVSDWRSKNG